VTPPQPALHVEVTGSGPPLVLLHGFTQTGRLWGPLGELLGAGRTVVRVDLPGHGGSSAAAVGFDDGVALLASVIDGPADVLGYSLGARWALHLALAAPERVARLVTIGATAGIRDPRLRKERRLRDDAMADELERSGDLATFLERWLASPMFSRLVATQAQVEERERNTPAGLASSLRLAGAGVQEPLWDRLGALAMPTLLVAGAQDVRYGALGAEMARAAPHAVMALVPGAGHAAHLERPALCGAIIGHWLAAGRAGA
jgi:2-succinyl-6-hydroxy-2,4-cyclohexadiene-1-carboxylate synthase